MLERLIFPREVRPIRKLLMLHALAGGGSVVEDTVTGNPLTFLTDLAKPLRSVLATWQPHQSGSGDPSPSNVRPVVGMDGVNVWHSGVNVFDGILENGYLNTTTGENTGSSNIRSKNYIPVVPGKTYRLVYVGAGSGSNMRVLFYGKDKTYTGTNAWASANVYTIPSNAYYMRFYMDSDYTSAQSREIAINYPSTETEYTPYHGTSYSVAFPAFGANKWDEQLVVGAVTSDGTVDSSLTSRRTTSFIPVVPGETYWYKAPSSASFGRSAYYDANKNLVSYNSDGIGHDRAVIIPEGCYYLRITLNSSYGTTYNHDISFNYPVTATSYEPYNATVYGGTLDLTTGVLTATHIAFDKKWSEYTFISTTDGYTAKKLETKADIYNTSQAASRSMCNIMAYSWNGSSLKKPHYYINDDANTTVYAYLTDDVSEDTRILIVTQLKTPVVLATLSPTQITALIGNNTMWADADDLSVTYLKKG